MSTDIKMATEQQLPSTTPCEEEYHAHLDIEADPVSNNFDSSIPRQYRTYSRTSTNVNSKYGDHDYSKKIKLSTKANKVTLDTNNVLTPEVAVHPDVKLSNSFAPLQQTMDEEIPSTSAPTFTQTSTGPTSSHSNPTPKQPRMPPIVVKKLPDGNIFEHNRKLQTLLGQPMKISYSVDGIKYHTSNRADYDKLYSVFQSESIPFYSHEPRATKLLHIVLKGLPVNVEALNLKQELEQLQFTIEHVRQITVADTTTDGILFRRPVPIWVITLPNTEHSRNIFNLRDINHHTIKIESYKPNPRVTQCHRCQDFGHTSRRCNLKIQCVKCGQDHLFINCPQKGSAFTPKCANCGGQHTASYGNCPVQLKHREALIKKLRTRSTVGPPTYFCSPWQQSDFPPLPRAETPLPSTHSESFTSILKEIITLFQEINLSHFLSVVRTTFQRFRDATDLPSKALIILEAFTKITSPTVNGP